MVCSGLSDQMIKSTRGYLESLKFLVYGNAIPPHLGLQRLEGTGKK